MEGIVETTYSPNHQRTAAASFCNQASCSSVRACQLALPWCLGSSRRSIACRASPARPSSNARSKSRTDSQSASCPHRSHHSSPRSLARRAARRSPSPKAISPSRNAAMAWLIESNPARPAARRKRSTRARPSGVKTGTASKRLFRPRVTRTHSPSASASSTAARSTRSSPGRPVFSALPRSMRAWAATDVSPISSAAAMARSAHSTASSRWSWSMWDWAMAAIARARRPPGGSTPIRSARRSRSSSTRSGCPMS